MSYKWSEITPINGGKYMVFLGVITLVYQLHVFSWSFASVGPILAEKPVGAKKPPMVSLEKKFSVPKRT